MGDSAVSAGIMDWGLLLHVERCQVLRKGNMNIYSNMLTHLVRN